MRRRAWAGLVVAGGVVTAGLLDTDEAGTATASSCQVATPRGFNGGAQVVIHRSGSEHVLAPGSVLTEPSFSPDGARVAVINADGDYESSGPNSTQLWTLSTLGGEPTVLVSGDGFVDWPDWSPDGATIAFAEMIDGSFSFELRTIPAGGGDSTTLLRSDDRSLSTPTWSPDGTTIAYLASDGSVNVVSARGADDRRVAYVRGANWLTWAPDGRSLLVSIYLGESFGTILRVDVADGHVDELATGALAATSAADGTVVHLREVEDAGWRVEESRIAGDRLEHVRFVGEELVHPYPYFGLDAGRCPDR
jgi:dipeptidyl aminopeptidase/acylaminoacyl peptidase